jgi:hypothetical protein
MEHNRSGVTGGSRDIDGAQEWAKFRFRVATKPVDRSCDIRSAKLPPALAIASRCGVDGIEERAGRGVSAP